MTITIRPFQEKNEEFVLGLNKKDQEVLIPMDNKEIRFLCDKAELFDIAYVDDVPAGYIIALSLLINSIIYFMGFEYMQLLANFFIKV